MDVSPAALLNGSFPRPKAAYPLYSAISEVLTCTPDGTCVRAWVWCVCVCEGGVFVCMGEVGWGGVCEGRGGEGE